MVIAAHTTVWCAAYAGAYLLRFDGDIPRREVPTLLLGMPILVGLRVALFWWSGLFHGILRYAGVPELKSIIRAATLASAAFMLLAVMVPALRPPRSVYAGEWLLAIMLASGIRLSARIFTERGQRVTARGNAVKAVLIGAGDAGEMFLRDLARHPGMQTVVVGILDDDASKHGGSVRGVRVLGAVDEAHLRRVQAEHQATLAILAMPSASGARIREIITVCRALGLQAKTLPSLQQIVAGDVEVSMLRDVAIEDLLRREPIELDHDSMLRQLRGRRALITGGAGSIGRELALQACRFEPASIAILDHNENGLFFLERSLRHTFPRIEIVPIIADVKDAGRVSEVLREFGPHVVFHAAAHKHVPLMEQHPQEAVKNNVFGTRIVADLCNAYGVETFVLVSTDKAVNPTSVMGTTKRVAEMYVQALSRTARTRLVTVRFGNVLGSDGSVVQVFREQIAAGGPVTVTHPEMTRYFMTIPEACQLVLQAGALAQGGEVFVLDMGEPVKVMDLARDMIRMSGFEPDVDVQIKITGARPGEKLFEELMHADEVTARRVHPKIFVGNVDAPEMSPLRAAFADLVSVLDRPAVEVRSALARIVPEASLGNDGAPRQAEAERVLSTLTEISTVAVAKRA